MKTAVIGASGYIGKHLLKKYRETYVDCIGTGFSHINNGLVSFDLRNPNVTSLKLKDTGHDAVVIASAIPNIAKCESFPQESYELNVTGTLKLVEQLDKLSIKTFFLSSDYVFNGDTGQYSDQAETNPNTEYGRQKAEVEKRIPDLTDNYAILRLSKIYGTTWQDKTLLDDMAASLMRGEKITVAADQFFSPTHVDDVVAMLLYIQKEQIKGLVNLCHNNAYSRAQLAYQLAEKLPVSAALLHEVKLHSIPAMQNRPLNTSLVCSSCLQDLQPSLKSIENAIDIIALNWQNYNPAML